MWEGHRHLSEKERASPLAFTCRSAEARAGKARVATTLRARGGARAAAAAARAGPSR